MPWYDGFNNGFKNPVGDRVWGVIKGAVTGPIAGVTHLGSGLSKVGAGLGQLTGGVFAALAGRGGDLAYKYGWKNAMKILYAKTGIAGGRPSDKEIEKILGPKAIQDALSRSDLEKERDRLKGYVAGIFVTIGGGATKLIAGLVQTIIVAPFRILGTLWDITKGLFVGSNSINFKKDVARTWSFQPFTSIYNRIKDLASDKPSASNIAAATAVAATATAASVAATRKPQPPSTPPPVNVVQSQQLGAAQQASQQQAQTAEPLSGQSGQAPSTTQPQSQLPTTRLTSNDFTPKNLQEIQSILSRKFSSNEFRVVPNGTSSGNAKFIAMGPSAAKVAKEILDNAKNTQFAVSANSPEDAFELLNKLDSAVFQQVTSVNIGGIGGTIYNDNNGSLKALKDKVLNQQAQVAAQNTTPTLQAHVVDPTTRRPGQK